MKGKRRLYETGRVQRLAAIAAADLRSPTRKRRYNRCLFAQVAPRYQLATRCLSFGRDRHWKALLLDRLPEATEPVVVDLACGTGDLALALARRYPSGQVTGLDISSRMLQRAQQRAAGAALHNLRFAEADMDDLPLPPQSVDIVTGGYAIRNAPDLQNALFEIYRVLRPGGMAAFLEFASPPQRWRRTLQLRLLRLWGQIWGLLLHGNPEVYAYIARSLTHFPDSQALDCLLQRIGFAPPRSRSLMAGFVRATWVTKPFSA